jgi:superfamily II DNA or RNA helicase
MEMIPKEVLLKRDPGLEKRPYQLEALQSIFLYAKCLVKMFCGTGKSRIITNVIIHEKKELSVVVFPSLALISQYSSDYLNNEEYTHHFKKHKTMNVSSERLDNMESTTDAKEINKFLKYKNPKIILVTYQSYQVLLDCLEGKKIGLVCYDEAHHVVSPETQKLVFGTSYYEKEIFFTATPKNENGITMFDRDVIEKNMCGPVAYDYTYLQGLVDEVLNAFEICIDMYTDNTNASIYEALARAILSRNTSRVLSFHSGVNGESNTNVKNFVNEAEFKEAFAKVKKAEFPEKVGYYTKITFKGMDGNTPSIERKAMLKELDDTPNNEIYIIASCETIGEGVDTKKANMCLFADPKSSITKIIQNIGRVVRRNKAHPLSTILIPCWVNMENYAEAGGDRAKQDELIRQQMRSEKGDYASILNVLGALRQEDPELYEMCLNYSDSCESEADYDEEESVSEADTESVSASEAEEDTDSASDEETDTEDRRPNKRIRMSIRQNDDIQMLWGVKGELDFSQKFCSVVIECEVSYGAEFWRLKHTELIAYMEEHKQLPSTVDQKSEIRTLGRWVNTQRKNYPNNVYIMLNPEIRSEWETTLQKYGDYLCNQFKKWSLKHAQLIAYMDKEKKSPSDKNKNPVIKKLGQWVSDQKKSYKKNVYCMSNKEIRLKWEATLQKYEDYLSTNPTSEWRLKHAQLIAYMEKEKKSPSDKNKNPVIQTLSTWLGTQKTNYRRNVSIISSNLEIRSEWETTLQKYGDYLCVPCEKWRLKHGQLIAYINEHKKRPSEDDKNSEIKKIGQWTSTQKQNYKKNTNIMATNPTVRAEWETTLVKYREYLKQSIIPLTSQPEAPPPEKPKLTRKKKQTAIPLSAVKATEGQTTPHHFPPPSEIGLLHKTYLKMRSDTLNAKFKADPQLWRDYHATRKRNFATYDPASIPSNQIIQELEKIQTKRRKVVVDMGCGEAPIAHHFQNDSRFTFHNYDHQSGGDPLIQEVDISALPLDDADAEIAIMSLALWGTHENCVQYIKEAYRILESGGKFYISDSTKKWSPENPTQENGGELLRTLLTTNGFKIINETIGTPFCFFECNKIY